jgi:hypothetical protein
MFGSLGHAVSLTGLFLILAGETGSKREVPKSGLLQLDSNYGFSVNRSFNTCLDSASSNSSKAQKVIRILGF